MAEDLFPALPEDLSTLSDAELEKLRKDHVAAAELIDQNDAAFLGERTAEDILAQYDKGIEQLKAIVDAETARAEARENMDEELAKRQQEREALIAPKAEADADEPVPSDEGDGDEGDGAVTEDAPIEVAAEAETVEVADEPAEEAKEKERELVLASAEEPKQEEKPKPIMRRSVPASRPAPAREEDEGKVVLRASGGLGSARAGEKLDDSSLVQALIEASSTTMAKPGYSEKVVVAHADIPYPEERVLDGRTPETNAEKIHAVMPPSRGEALVASGGLCAPLTPLYDLPVFSIADRPVRDSLPSFQAARGGVSVPSAITMADVSSGVDIVTAAQDEAAGTDVYPKSCLDVTCDPFTDYEISMIYACVTHGNLGARSWPERVRAVAELQAAWHARIAEENLLNGIDFASTNVTVSATYGAASSIIDGLLAASDGMRSRHRLDPNAVMRVLLPEWSRGLLVADVVNSQFGRFDVRRNGVGALLSEMGNINPVFYYDEASGAGQIFGAESGGALNPWPSTLHAYMYPEGSFIFLDQGTLDLGIVRDSVLNSTNDFQTFMETFEGIAYVGIESLDLAFTVCPSGVVAAPASGISCPFFD